MHSAQRAPPHLRKYFDRIRGIRVSTSSWMKPLTTTLRRLPQPPFPHMTKLILSIDSDLTNLDLLFTPNLRVLSVTISSDTDVPPIELVRAFWHQTPHLNDLHLEWLGEDAQDPNQTREVLYMITELKELKRLSINLDLSKEPQFLQILSALRSLEELCLTCPVIDRNNPPWDIVACRDFPSIHSLCLICPARMAEALLPALRGTAISHLNLAIQDSLPAREQSALSSSIVDHFPSAAKSVTVRIPEGLGFAPGWGEVGVILPQCISSLLPLHLTELHLGYMHAEDVSNVLCRNMAESWPQLRCLAIMTDMIVRQPPARMVTLAGLKWFAIGCHDLSEITIQVNGLGHHWEDEIDAFLKPKASKLMLLNLQGSSVNDPLSVAKYLRWCFPTLRDVRFSKLDIIEPRDSEIMQACATIRAMFDDGAI